MSRSLVASSLLLFCAGCFSEQAGAPQSPDSSPPIEAVSEARQNTKDWPEIPASHISGDRGAAETPELILDDEQVFELALRDLAVAAAQHESAGQFEAALESRREMLEKLERRFGSKSWQAINGRLAVAHVVRLSELTFEQRGKLVEIGEAERWSAAHAAQGSPREALVEAERAVTLTREVWGEDYYLTANRWFDLAQIHHALREYEAAQNLYLKTLASRQKTFGREHPDYVAILNALATHYQSMQNYAQADRVLREAAQIDKGLWGESHPTYATQLNNLGMLQQSLGKPAAAAELLRQSADIRRETLGAENPNYAHSLYNLGSVYYAAKELDKAAPLFEEALPIFASGLGPNHQMTLLTKNNLAMVELGRKDPARAETLLSEVADAVREQSGEDSTSYATAIQQLAVAYSHQLKYRESDELLAQAQGIHELAVGPDHESVGNILELRATILRQAKRTAEADRLEARAKSITARSALR